MNTQDPNAMEPKPAESASSSRRRILLLIPLVVFLALTGLFLFQLSRGNPTRLPSALIGRMAPQTELPPLAGLTTPDGKPVPGLTPALFQGQVTLVNVWASWCIPCRDEAPLLEKMARDTRFQMVAINYKDNTDNARRFIGRYGNPFSAIGVDESGRAAIDWGVYGVPENFVIGRDGRIAYKLVGPITPENLAAVLMPAIERALAQAAPDAAAR
jgi:cytochrome c biogenesis protein CcmG/thiol:disulfide interchange protein DsbE